MNPSHPSRRRRASRIGVESLEGRALLTGSMGSTFAIVPGTIDKAGGTSSFSFTIDPSHFTMPQSGKIVIGIDVATPTGSKLVPNLVDVTDSQGHHVQGTKHARYTPGLARTATSFGNQTSAILTSLSLEPGNKPATYTVTVKGERNSQGNFLLGFYLAGDANGDGIVNQGDVAAVQQVLGKRATSTNYSFDADVNRDGQINRADLKVVRSNSGAMTTINPSITANLDPASDTGLQDRITAERTVHFTGTTSPGATVAFTNTNTNGAPTTTTADSTGNYSIMVNLGDGSNTFQVQSTDAFGQKITGTIAAVTYNPNAPKSLLSFTPTSGDSTSQNTSNNPTS